MTSRASKCDHHGPCQGKPKIKIRAIGPGGDRGIGEVDERGPCNPEGEDVRFIMQPHVKVGVRREGVGGDQRPKAADLLEGT